MAFQRLWSKDFYDSLDDGMSSLIKAAVSGGFSAILISGLFGLLFYLTDRNLQVWLTPISCLVYALSLWLIALKRLLAGRLLLLYSTITGIMVLGMATGPAFGIPIFMITSIPGAILVFKHDEQKYRIQTLIYGFLNLGVALFLPGKLDLNGWHAPFDEQTNTIAFSVIVLIVASLLAANFYNVFKESETRAIQQAYLRKTAEAQTAKLEQANTLAEQAKNRAEQESLLASEQQQELQQTLEKLEEREKDIAQANQELKSSEEELRQNLEELEATQEQMQQAQLDLSIKDEIFKQSVVPIAAGSDTLQEFNKAFYQDLLGYDDEQALKGKRLRDLSPPRQLNGQLSEEVAIAFAKQLQETPEMSFEWLFIRKDGSTVLTDVTISPLDVDQEKFEGGLMLMARDITERKQQERQLQEQNILIRQNQRRMKKTVRELESARESERFLTSFNDLLRFREDDELNTWADRLIEALAPELKALQVTFYVRDYETDSEEDQQTLPRLKYLTGYAQPESCPEYIDWGEGLMGQAARTGRPFEYRQNGSSKKRRIGRVQTGLLAVRMSYARVQPIMYSEEVVGTIELTCFKALTEQQIQLLEEASQRIGAALATLRNQFRVRALFEEAQKNAQRLKQQELELRQNIDQLNTAQEEMKRAQDDVSKLNDELEERVQSRTAELEQAMAKVESTQSQLVMSEKMAALGQLVAGIAHEINSPLGAIKASSSTMQDLLPNAITDMPKVLLSLKPEQLDLFIRLVQNLLEGDPQNLTSKEERQLRKDYQQLLENEGVEQARKIAKDIVGAGFHGEIEPYMALFKSAEAKQITDLLYYLGQLNVNLANINLAADKTKKVVFALKSYAHRSDQDELTPTDLTQNIETVLTIYHNQIKYGIDLDTNLKQVPPVMVNPDEISQVWTNLIQNAIQAMNSEGQMIVESYQENDFVVVAVEDKGSGIPREIQEKIFEPFFTTKKKGEGTGLGLDICKKIVEKFGGTLSFESEPGRTRFETRLPVASEAEFEKARRNEI